MGDVAIRHGLYLTTGRTEDGRMMAICSDGTPQLGHSPVNVLTIEAVKSFEDAQCWFNYVKQTKPWETRQ